MLKRFETRGGPTAPDFRVSIIGPHSSMAGLLRFDGELRLEGRVEGQIRCQRLIIGPSGVLEGTIIGDVVRVHGRVEGRIVAKEVAVCDGAVVKGEIQHQGFSLAASARFEGTVQRLDTLFPLNTADPPWEALLEIVCPPPATGDLGTESDLLEPAAA